jgi:hypothetical protein
MSLKWKDSMTSWNFENKAWAGAFTFGLGKRSGYVLEDTRHVEIIVFRDVSWTMASLNEESAKYHFFGAS